MKSISINTDGLKQVGNQNGLYLAENSEEKMLCYNGAVYSRLKKKSIYTGDYYDYFLPPAYVRLSPSILIVGMGAGTTVIQLCKLLPGINIDAVEINEDVVSKSWIKQFASLTRNCNIIVQEGASYVRDQDSRYDLIIVDAFVGDKIPEQFTTPKFLENASKALKRDGIFIMNTGTGYVDNRTTIFPYNYRLSAGNNSLAMHSKMPKDTMLLAMEERVPKNFSMALVMRAYKEMREI